MMGAGLFCVSHGMRCISISHCDSRNVYQAGGGAVEGGGGREGSSLVILRSGEGPCSMLQTHVEANLCKDGAVLHQQRRLSLVAMVGQQFKGPRLLLVLDEVRALFGVGAGERSTKC